MIDDFIRLYGPEAVFGDDPGYSDEEAVEIALRILGWGRQHS